MLTQQQTKVALHATNVFFSDPKVNFRVLKGTSNAVQEVAKWVEKLLKILQKEK